MVIKDERDLGRIGDGDGVWPKREVHADGTVTESWEGIHEYPERLVREAAERMRTEGATPGTQSDDRTDDPWSVPGLSPVTSTDGHGDDDQPADWLDDYEEGSTSEEFLDRMKRGALLWTRDATPEEIARGTVEHFAAQAGEEHKPDAEA